ncbi:MAG TPA: T9SS type A sorting domain-containing protein [Chitinophagaceae bacterium]|nr:T9SS type A sorting domain-containing protein [Chitinophagaceae bacterium]
MKRVALLVLVTSFVLPSLAQSNKNRSISGFAITPAEKGKGSWNEVRLIDLQTGEVLQPVYSSKQEVEILNARTRVPVKAKEPVARLITRKIVNLDHELQPSKLVFEKHRQEQHPERPFATNSAAMAYDRKNERLYYTPMGIAQLRCIDLRSNRIYYFEDEMFGVLKNSGDVPNQITRMSFAADGSGYALTNNGQHLIRFTAPRKLERTEITNLGALSDDPANARNSVHDKAGYGGDMFADAQDHLYLVTANRKIFRIDIRTRVATYLGSISGLPAGFSTNAAMVEDGERIIVASAQSTAGYFRFDLRTLQAEKISGSETVFNASDLANGALARARKKKEKQDPQPAQPEISQQQESKQQSVAQTETARGLSVYPNPVTAGYFHVSFSEQPSGKYQLQLYDVAGKLVSSREVTISNGTQVERFELPASATAGSYLLKVVNEASQLSFSSKLTVQ